MATIEQRSSRYIAFIVIYMGLVGLLDNYLSLVETVAVPYILAEFGLLPWEFAFWQSLYGIITFSVFFLGWFTDAFGRKKGVLVLILIMGIPALLIGLTAFTFHLFMILYAIIITITLSNMWELPVTEEAQPAKRGLYGGIAILISLIPIYAIIGEPIAENLGWRWTYGIMFFFMLVLLVMWYFMKEPQRWLDAKKKRDNQLLRIKTALTTLTRKDVTYLAISTLVYGVWTISFKMGTTWGGHFYKNILGYTSPQFQTVLTIAGLLTMAGALTSGVLMDKIGRTITLVFGCIGAVIGFVFLGITGLPLFFWMVYFFMPLVFAWIMVYFAEIFPTEIRSTATGLSATVVRSSYVIGPLIASLLLATFPTMDGFWIVAGLFMLIPIASVLLKPYETKGKTLEEIQEER